MPVNKTLNKIFKWVGYTFIILLMFSLLIQVFLMLFAEDFLEKKLKELVSKQSKGVYSLNFDEFDLYLYNRGLSIENLHLRADSSKLYQNKSDSSKSIKSFEVKIEKLKISGVHYWQLVMNRKLVINDLLVERPLVVSKKYKDGKDTSKQEEIVPDLYKIIKEDINTLEIKNIKFNQGSLSSENFQKAKPQRLELDGIAIHIKDFKIDSASSISRKDLKYARYFETKIQSFITKTADSYYEISTGPIHYQSASDIITVDSIQLLPRYGLYEFAQKKGHEIDRMKISHGNLQVRKFSLIQFLQNNNFKAEKITLSDFSLDVFRDKRLPFPENHRPKMPHELIRDLEMDLHIDSIAFINWNIAYSEHVKDSEKPGTVTFNNLFATLYNITNDSVSLAKDPFLEIDVQANLMDKGRLKVHIQLPVSASNNKFELNGTLGEMPINALNPMTIHTAFVKVEDGKVNEMVFSMDATDDVASGEMIFRYEDFKVTMIEKETKDEKAFKSFLANLLVIKTNNPSGNTLRKGLMEFERDKSKSIFNYWWKTLLTGLKESIGMAEAEKIKVSKKEQKEKKKFILTKHNKKLRHS